MTSSAWTRKFDALHALPGGMFPRIFRKLGCRKLIHAHARRLEKNNNQKEHGNNCIVCMEYPGILVLLSSGVRGKCGTTVKRRCSLVMMILHMKVNNVHVIVPPPPHVSCFICHHIDYTNHMNLNTNTLYCSYLCT